MAGRRPGGRGLEEGTSGGAPAGIVLTPEELGAIINQAVTAALAAAPPAAQQAPLPPQQTGTYKSFMDCKPLSFNGTEGAVGLTRWIEKAESAFPRSHCQEADKVSYAAGTLEGAALTWWNNLVKTLGQEEVDALTWTAFKERLTKKYCSTDALEKLELELQELKMVGSEIEAYTTRSHELAALCPDMATPASKHLKKYIQGLPAVIKSNLVPTKPKTLDEAIELAHQLTDLAVEQGTLPARGASSSSSSAAKSQDGKRKWDGNTSNQPQQQQRRFESPKPLNRRPQGSQYTSKLPYCSQCNYHHHGNCTVMKCRRCGRTGHTVAVCRAAQPQQQQQQPQQ